MAKLAQSLSTSPYPDAGLHAMPFMLHDLKISRARDITGNPHLNIHWDDENREFQFTYEDGSPSPWSRTCKEEDALEVIDRFLTKRARWVRIGEVKDVNG